MLPSEKIPTYLQPGQDQEGVGEKQVNLKMKTTQYFKHTRKRPDRARIKYIWIEFVINNPVKTEVQSDNRIKKWAKIPEEDKYLRVILLEDGETIHNAFFDINQVN